MCNYHTQISDKFSMALYSKIVRNFYMKPANVMTNNGQKNTWEWTLITWFLKIWLVKEIFFWTLKDVCCNCEKFQQEKLALFDIFGIILFRYYTIMV